VVIDGSADGTIKINKSIGHHDNNVAEYAALLEALQFATLFSTLDLPKVGPFARLLHLAHTS
jgi:ribonuclease HI